MKKIIFLVISVFLVQACKTNKSYVTSEYIDHTPFVVDSMDTRLMTVDYIDSLSSTHPYYNSLSVSMEEEWIIAMKNSDTLFTGIPRPYAEILEIDLYSMSKDSLKSALNAYKWVYVIDPIEENTENNKLLVKMGVMYDTFCHYIYNKLQEMYND